ncbi:hypothetical protein LTR84_003558 [Exophiala bonariae]|uniref:HD domain-containing protein n=1 Tax=Exophiala bonariae TaxID=1690606 RepID=A0AAV9N9J3_9EURO|nr:hypothetical protein LTR84_003558 [Exophiala bonariae]
MCPPSTNTGPSAEQPDETILAQLDSLVPDTPLSKAILRHVVSALPLSIVHHSLRVYLFANWLAHKEASPLADGHLLFAACVGHDLGASHLHNATSERFEVEGADTTVALLREHHRDLTETDAHDVWVAIALHTSPHIAERITPLARLVRLAVLIDFRPLSRQSHHAVDYGREIEIKLPRLDIEKILADAVVHQAVQNPLKAPPASWPNALYKSHLENPDWTGVNKGF